jgi:hypothetical protein
VSERSTPHRRAEEHAYMTARYGRYPAPFRVFRGVSCSPLIVSKQRRGIEANLAREASGVQLCEHRKIVQPF